METPESNMKVIQVPLPALKNAEGQSKRLFQLDSLRGLAAFAVLFSHFVLGFPVADSLQPATRTAEVTIWLLSAIGALMLVAVALNMDRVIRILEHEIISLGGVVYCRFHLWNFVVLIILGGWSAKCLFGSAGDVKLHGWLAVLAVDFLVCLAMSVISFYFIEKPAMVVGKWYSRIWKFILAKVARSRAAAG